MTEVAHAAAIWLEIVCAIVIAAMLYHGPVQQPTETRARAEDRWTGALIIVGVAGLGLAIVQGIT